MKKLLTIGLLGLAGAGAASAGTCNDPWVTRAIREVTGQAPTGAGNTGDCNIQNYGHGQWSSYADLLGKVRAAQSAHPAPAPAVQAGVCGDPWVTRAIHQVLGRAPNGSGNSGECAIQRYGNGHWTSYDDLVAKVRAASGITVAAPHPAIPAPAPHPVPGLAPGAGIVAQGGGNVVAPGGANIVAQGGGNIVAQGGGNLQGRPAAGIVAQGGGNVIAPGGANVVAAGGGNVIAPGGANIVAQGGGNVVAAGGGNIVAQGGGNMMGGIRAMREARPATPPTAAPAPAPAPVTVAAASGSCSDPWVTRAIHEVKGRAPQGSGSTGECDIHRYGGGQWSSYPDLVAKVRASGAPVTEREQVVNPNQQLRAQGLYESKRYPEAENALRCAGFRNVEPTRRPAPTYEVVPHPAVKHAADVDLRPHGNGAGLCKYLQQPQVQQWYRQNFHL